MYKIIYWLSVVVLLSNCTQPIFANSKEVSKKQELKRKNTLSNLNKGKSFHSQNGNYVFLPEVLSAQKQQVVKVEKIVSQSQSIVSGKHAVIEQDVIQAKERHIIFKSGQSQLDANTKTLPVVLNERTNQYGILTGTVIIKFKDMNNADLVKNQFSLTESKRYIRLNRIVYQTTPSEAIVDLASQIKSNFPECEVEIEVLENFMVPR